jgi:hypothetical protein
VALSDADFKHANVKASETIAPTQIKVVRNKTKPSECLTGVRIGPKFSGDTYHLMPSSIALPVAEGT